MDMATAALFVRRAAAMPVRPLAHAISSHGTLKTANETEMGNKALAHPLPRGSVKYFWPCPKHFPTLKFRTFLAVSCFLSQFFRVQSRLRFIF